MRKAWVLLPIVCFFKGMLVCAANDEPVDQAENCAGLNLRYTHRSHGESVVTICDKPQLTSLKGLRCVERGESRRTLFIAKTGIKKIQANAFEHAGNPHKLALSGHTLEEIDDDAFVGLTNLKSLILTRNEIATITPRMLEPCENLEELNLCGNPIPQDQIDSLRAALPHVTIKASDL